MAQSGTLENEMDEINRASVAKRRMRDRQDALAIMRDWRGEQLARHGISDRDLTDLLNKLLPI